MGAVGLGVTAVVAFGLGALFGWELHGLWRQAIGVVIVGGLGITFAIVILRYLAHGRRRWFES